MPPRKTSFSSMEFQVTAFRQHQQHPNASKHLLRHCCSYCALHLIQSRVSLICTLWRFFTPNTDKQHFPSTFGKSCIILLMSRWLWFKQTIHFFSNSTFFINRMAHWVSQPGEAHFQRRNRLKLSLSKADIFIFSLILGQFSPGDCKDKELSY